MNVVNREEVQNAINANDRVMRMVKESMGIERFTEAALSLVANTQIAQCSLESVLGCLVKAATFGFRLSPELGMCWLVPRNIKTGEDGGKPVFTKVATFQIGYKGWMELAFRSGEIESFSAAMVYANDTFDFEMGTNGFLKHKPVPKEKGMKTWVWAKAVMRSGREVFNVVDIDEVERHRRMSDTQTIYDEKTRQKITANDPVGVWALHYDAMAKRIPMKGLCTLQLPKTELILQAVEFDGSSSDTKGDIQNNDILQLEENKLHDDYVMEVENETSEAGLRSLWASRKNELTGQAREDYYNLIVNQQRKMKNG